MKFLKIRFGTTRDGCACFFVDGMPIAAAAAAAPAQNRQAPDARPRRALQNGSDPNDTARIGSRRIGIRACAADRARTGFVATRRRRPRGPIAQGPPGEPATERVGRA